MDYGSSKKTIAEPVTQHEKSIIYEDGTRVTVSGHGGAGYHPDYIIDNEAIRKYMEDSYNRAYKQKSNPVKDRYNEKINSERDILSRIKEVKESIAFSKDRLDKLEALADKLANSSFNVGSVAFVKQLGNVIIQGIYVDENCQITGYRVNHTNGSRDIDASEILPYTEATKVLYGNK